MNFLTQGFWQVLKLLYQICGDYGIAIVLLTLAVRLILLPFSVRQKKQMEKQQKLAKYADEIKIRYANHPEKQQKELQKLYEEHGVGGMGCLLSLLQFPVMICLYQAIRLGIAAETATILLPWVGSLLMRDQTFLLPFATLVVQLLPQLYPYIRYFRVLKLQKPNKNMMLVLLLSNGMFAFLLPSGVGLYLFVSGSFAALEQFFSNMASIRKLTAA